MMESLSLRDINWSSVMVPALKRQEYKMGAECPLERTNLSLRKCEGLLLWNFNPDSWKKRTEKRSAMDEQEVGWPLLVTLTDRMESILSQWAMSWEME